MCCRAGIVLSNITQLNIGTRTNRERRPSQPDLSCPRRAESSESYKYGGNRLMALRDWRHLLAEWFLAFSDGISRRNKKTEGWFFFGGMLASSGRLFFRNCMATRKQELIECRAWFWTSFWNSGTEKRKMVLNNLRLKIEGHMVE